MSRQSDDWLHALDPAKPVVDAGCSALEASAWFIQVLMMLIQVIMKLTGAARRTVPGQQGADEHGPLGIWSDPDHGQLL